MEKENKKTYLSSPLAGEDARRVGEGDIKGNTSLSPLIGFECIRTQNHFPRQGGRHTTYGNGFTLIELLVVVLIIGILAAVALPQYTLAVNKSRFANLRSMAHPYLQAMRSYHLANGEWPNDMDELEVEPPAGMSRINQLADNYSCAYNDEVFCCMQGAKKDGWASGMMCGRKDYSFVYSCLLDNTTFSPIGQDLCLAKTTDDNANKLCKALSQATSYHSGGITTPDGRQSTYNYYVVK